MEEDQNFPSTSMPKDKELMLPSGEKVFEKGLVVDKGYQQRPPLSKETTERVGDDVGRDHLTS